MGIISRLALGLWMAGLFLTLPLGIGPILLVYGLFLWAGSGSPALFVSVMFIWGSLGLILSLINFDKA